MGKELVNYKQLCEEFWEKAKAIGYVECTEYCVAIGIDSFGAEDVLLDRFYAKTKEEWENEVIEIMRKYYGYDDDDLYDGWCYSGEFEGEGEYVLYEWGQTEFVKIDENALMEEIRNEYKKRKEEGRIREVN